MIKIIELFYLNCINKNKYSRELFENRENNFNFHKKSKSIFNIVCLIFLLVARHLYIKSLLGCDGDEFICILNNGMKYIFDDIY